MVMRDGMRYRIVNGQVIWIRDRNGNKLIFEYEPAPGTFGRLLSVTDSLNRVVTITYGNPAVIAYKGYGGALRTVKIYSSTLSARLRAGYSIQTYPQLFPGFSGLSGTFNPVVVSAIELPNNQTYQFLYNSYCEVARVTLPTGGAVEYDYWAGVRDADASGRVGKDTYGVFYSDPPPPAPDIIIYRRLKERRVYVDGVTLESKTTYSRPERMTSETYSGVTFDSLDYVEVDQVTPGDSLLTRTRHYFHNIFQGPAERMLYWNEMEGYPNTLEGKEYKTEYFDSDGATMQVREEHTWTGPAITQTIKTLLDTNQVSKITYDYDTYLNLTDVREYDIGIGTPGPLIRHTQTSYLTTNQYQGNVNYATDPSINLRSLPAQISVFDGNGVEASRTSFEYDRYDLYPLQDCPNITQHDGGFHNGYGTRGNVTKVIRRLFPSTEIATFAQHDIAGNVVKTIDARSNATTLDFSDRFGSPGDDAEQNTPPAELNGQTSYAFATKVTNALGHTAYTKYDYYLGKPVNIEDANGVVSSVEYDDALDRPTQSIQARYKVGVGVPAERRQTTITYYDWNRAITTTSDRDAFNDNILYTVSYYDGLGRTWRGAAYEGSTWTIKDTQFDALGRVSQVSNPYRAVDPNSASPPAGLWTTTVYDALNRVISVTTPDGAHIDTAYSGNNTLVIDQAGKMRISRTDAVGRLTNVWEVRSPDAASGTVPVSFPNHPEITAGYQTDYLYDTLGNLLKVTQGVQTRWFSYDSLSRLIRVANPEQVCNLNLPPHTDPYTGGSCWKMAYSYDANGNLVSRTDARNITTTYTYDALNRNTLVDYSNTAVNPDITRFYDNAANGKGRFWQDYAEVAHTTEPEIEHNSIDSYDALGRPLTKRQHFKKNGIWSAPYSVSQDYDLAGNVERLTYPSGHFVDYSHDQAGRLSGFGGNLGGGATVNYADTIGYNAAGQMIKERFGTNTPLYHNSHYNNRMQLVDTRLGDSATDEWTWNRGATAFLYGSTAVAHWDRFASDTDNNGNLRRQINYAPLGGGASDIPQLADYYYDSLNRIAAVREQQVNASGQWTDSVSQVYRYDRWGNRTLDLSGTGSGEVVWVDDAAPAGASLYSDGGDSWTWVNSSPIPYSGTTYHASALAAGAHHHAFLGATQTLQVNAGDRLYAYVYLDPANPPSEVMLLWYSNESGWGRAYWGANNIPWGTDGTAERKYIGPLPAAGGWVRLDVPASAVELEGKTLNGMAFALYGGRAYWDKAGKVPLGGPPINNNVYTVDAASNHLATVNGFTILYDAAGNQTNDGSGQRIYDAENRMVEAYNGAVLSRYVYDAEGRRVRRIIGVQDTWQVYGIGGELLAEYAAGVAPSAPQKEYGYRNGQMLVVWDGSETGDRQLQWLVQDHLGSTRMVVDRSGSLAGVRRHDFLPFGEELSAGVGIRSASLGYGGDSTRQKFTSKERDSETGLDYFGARYFSSAQGRFTSPDALLSSGKQEDPQSWNRYSYVGNRPTIIIDPTGLAWGYFSGNGGSWYQWFDDPDDIANNGGSLVDINAGGKSHIYEAADGRWVRLDLTQNRWDAYETRMQAFYGQEEIPTAMGDQGNTLSLFTGAAGAANALKSLGRLAGGLFQSNSDDLVHLTTSEAANLIRSEGVLKGNIYAGPASNASASGWGVTLRTGLNPGNYESIAIPSSGLHAFSKVVPTGPFTAWQRLMGTQYTARGVLDLSTGAFTRIGINWNQVGWHAADATIVAGSGFTIYQSVKK